MTTTEEHEKTAREFLDDINEKIKANLLIERQKIIGFAASEASANLFAASLHRSNLIEPGFNVNHRHFGSLKMAESSFNFDFPNKNKILNLLVNQESYRNKLCYGKEKSLEIVNSTIENLFELKKLLESGGEKND